MNNRSKPPGLREALIRLVLKWACHHRWRDTGHAYTTTRTRDNSVVGYSHQVICKRCGRIRIITISCT